MGINQDKDMRAERLVGIFNVDPAFGDDVAVFKHIPTPIGTADQNRGGWRWILFVRQSGQLLIFGMGASLYVLEWWFLSFSNIVNTPVGVEWPGAPVEQVEIAIRMLLR